MPRRVDDNRRIVPPSEWPAGDQTLWDAAMANRHEMLAPHAYARRLSQASIHKNAKGYGRWLGFLASQQELDAAVSPAARVTPARLDAYFRHLIGLDNADHSITGRFWELYGSLRILEPQGQYGWIITPCGVPLRQFLPMQRQAVVIHHPTDLFMFGLDLMNSARDLPDIQRRGPRLRDGLLIALESLRALRLRSVHGLRLGHSIRHDNATGEWRLDLDPADVKNKRAISGPITAILAPWLDRYVNIERPEMLAGFKTDAFWVHCRPGCLSQSGLTNALVSRTAERFGKDGSFRSHHFRHCLASVLPLVVPEHPELASQLLAISHQTAARHYDRSSAVQAFRRYHAVLDAERERYRR